MVTKSTIIEQIKELLQKQNIRHIKIDDTRPWGGFFVIDENDASNFIDCFFPELDKVNIIKGKISPKILLVEPQKKLSWQYHHRRSEVWKLIEGEAAIVRSMTDEQTSPHSMQIGELLTLQQGERHRLVGSGQWGIVAEIWVHTDPKQPSDEEDIVRIEDDFGR